MSTFSSARLTDRVERPAAILGGLSRWKLFLALAALGALVSLLYVSQTGNLASTGYDVADLQTQKEQWQMRNEQLRLQIGQLESLDRVDRLASSDLKMGPPSHVIYVASSAVSIPAPPSTPTAAIAATP